MIKSKEKEFFMKCLNCNIEMLRVKSTNSVIRVSGNEIPRTPFSSAHTPVAILTPYLCPKCGLCQYYVDNPDKLKSIIESLG